MSMIRRANSSEALELSEILQGRKVVFPPEVLSSVEKILSAVRTRGDEALIELAKRFDGAEFASADELLVSEEELDAAFENIDAEDLEALGYAAEKIADFHSRAFKESWFTTDEQGTLLGSKVTPLRRVGIYVPGGRAFYPSTVLMNAMPASVAGVEEIVMVTPSMADGSIHPYTLASAAIAGVTEIYKVGGAHSVAALAYGTESIAPVDKIVGPGNIYVAAAKHLVQAEVAIDMIAGPSEVLIIADESANPRFIAIDLMAQAEHDPRATTYLLSVDESLFERVEAEFKTLLARSERAEVTRESLAQNCYFMSAADLDEAVELANKIAPEHLEVQTEDPLSLLGKIKNAGAIFLGAWTPESVGDYIAGPNHVLPTGGTARYASPLSTEDFIKRSSVVRYSAKALKAEAEHIERIAAMEGLWAHGEAVSLRIAELNGDK